MVTAKSAKSAWFSAPDTKLFGLNRRGIGNGRGRGGTWLEPRKPGQVRSFFLRNFVIFLAWSQLHQSGQVLAKRRGRIIGGLEGQNSDMKVMVRARYAAELYCTVLYCTLLYRYCAAG